MSIIRIEFPKIFVYREYDGNDARRQLNQFLVKSNTLKALLESLKALHDAQASWGPDIRKLTEYADLTKRVIRSAAGYDKWKAEKFKLLDLVHKIETQGYAFLQILGKCAQDWRKVVKDAAANGGPAMGPPIPDAGVFFLPPIRHYVTPHPNWEMGVYVDPDEDPVVLKKPSDWTANFLDKAGDATNAAAFVLQIPLVGDAVAVAKNAPRAYNARKYKRSLLEIQGNATLYERPENCRTLLNPFKQCRQHKKIFEDVLPCLIREMNKRHWRKVRAAVPGVRYVEKVRSKVGSVATSKKVQREMAYALTDHFLTHDCKLAQDIMAALWSTEEMEWMKQESYATVYDYVYRSFNN